LQNISALSALEVLHKFTFTFTHITVSHGSAYTVARATQQAMGNGNFGMSELCNPWTNWLKIWHVITSMSWPRMPNFIKFGGTRASRQYGEMYTSRTFFIFRPGNFSRASTEKNTQQFQAINGLKCSTVGILGS